jgi:hypothetical protein
MQRADDFIVNFPAWRDDTAGVCRQRRLCLQAVNRFPESLIGLKTKRRPTWRNGSRVSVFRELVFR